ncbi:MAG TPA: aminotransferase class III-fold pyridoxal phosphate-dependent enzyme [Armatimonadota bacterium]|jgi:putrescine aminotransferase
MKPFPANPEDFNDEIVEKYRKYVNPGLAQLMKFGGYGSVEWTGDGVYITDTKGEKYLDALAGYGVFSLGHRHPRILEAVKRQMDQMPLSTRQFFTAPMAELAEELAAIAPGDLQYSFFCHSGTEAVEGALKCARISSGKSDIIFTTNAFHGKTMGSLSAGGRDVYRTRVEPLVPGFHKVQWGDLEPLVSTMNDHTAAVIIEAVQGEGGINPAPAGYMEGVRKACDEHGVLMIVDEVQTGFGRTGKMFAIEHAGVAPDIMCMAKALGGGITSTAAFMGTPAVWDGFFKENPTIHTTSIVNLAAMAAGLETLKVIKEDGLVANAQAMGKRCLDGMKGVMAEFPDLVTEVRGLGLMVGVQFAEKDFGLLTIAGLANRHIIAGYTLANPNVIRVEPPLIINAEQIDHLVESFRGALVDCRQMFG